MIFSISYYCAYYGVDDYSNWVKAGISIPFFLLGRIYMEYAKNILQYKYLLWMISFSAYIWVINKDTNMCFRILEIPHNPIEYLLYPIVGVFFVLITIQVTLHLFSKVFFKTRFTSLLTMIGQKSLFILCLHWPILQFIRHFINLDGNYLGFLITVLLCIICTITGIYLTQWFPSIFNSNARKN